MNPRDVTITGLAILRLTGLGHPRKIAVILDSQCSLFAGLMNPKHTINFSDSSKTDKCEYKKTTSEHLSTMYSSCKADGGSNRVGTALSRILSFDYRAQFNNWASTQRCSLRTPPSTSNGFNSMRARQGMDG